ncbi:MAG TPA: divergent PAP2 family protein [Candidatus Saccharimonadales bacterium]|nr:divergent PAP2 family protein [Candidatus Saccharimonadales bacterium]
MYNAYIVVPFVVWAITQFLKFSIAALAGRVDFRYLYASGGMPSVHSAVVVSLATTAFLVDGPSSSIFGLTAIFAAVVMYDSFGVRRASGEQAVAINEILDKLREAGVASQPRQHLREILGHKPLEVTVGAVTGLLLGCLFNIDRMGPALTWLSQPVNRTGIYVLAGASVLLIVGPMIRRFLALRKYKDIPVVVEATIRSFWTFVTIGFVGLFVAFLQYEKVQAALWIVWPIKLAIIFVIAAAYFLIKYRSTVPEAVRAHEAAQDKKKWHEGPNKKRRAKAERSRKRK